MAEFAAAPEPVAGDAASLWGMMHGFLAHAGVVDGARTAFDDIGATIRARLGVVA